MIKSGYLRYFIGAVTSVMVCTGVYLAVVDPEKFGDRLFELLTVSVTGLFALANPKSGE